MLVWLLHIGEDLPVDGNARRYRYSYLADALIANGHNVLRWAPTFRHTTKQHRFHDDRRVEINPHYAIQFVHSTGYHRNVSFQRLRSYREMGRKIRGMIASEPLPDVIVAAIPSLEWADEAVAFGRARSIPVVIDVRDLWPDVFFNALPKTIRSLGRLLFAPYRQIAKRACRGATMLTGVSREYLEWALRLAGRPANRHDRVAYLGFESPTAVPEQLHARLATLVERGIDPDRPTCLFAGLFERSCDLDTIVDAVRRLALNGQNDFQFVLCGAGSKLAQVRRRADDLSNVHLLGWVDPPTLQAIASFASIGLCAYSADATQSLPNKPFEYMASRLAVVSSLTGELEQLLDQHRCGLTYRAGDVDALADCLAQLLDDPARLRSMQNNGFEAWQSYYQSRDLYARFADSITSLSRTALCPA
jgi:glycosyltransferase involved in cell wall biosynthesis